MRVIQRLTNGLEERQRLVPRDTLPGVGGNRFGQAAIPRQLRHLVEIGFRLADVIDGRQMGMLETGSSVQIVAQAGDPRFILQQQRIEELDGHQTAYARVFGAVNGGKTPLAQHAQYAIFT